MIIVRRRFGKHLRMLLTILRYNKHNSFKINTSISFYNTSITQQSYSNQFSKVMNAAIAQNYRS